MKADEPAAEAERKPRASWLRWALGLLLAAGFVGAMGELAAHREALHQTDAMRRTLEIHTLGLRGAATRFEYLPFAVATHQHVQAALARPDDPVVLDQANRFLEQVNQRAGSSALYVMNLQGKTLAASNWALPGSFVGHVYRDRPYFSEARNGRKGMFYGVGLTTKLPGLFMASPVIGPAGDTIGVVAVKVSLDPIEAAWAHVRDPILLSDARGIVFLGNVAAWQYRTRRALDEMGLEWLRYYRQYGELMNFEPLPWDLELDGDASGYALRTSLSGQRRAFMAIDEALPEFGWTLTVMADRAEVNQARQTAWALASLAALALLLAGLYWQLRERRLVEQRDARRQLEARVLERTHELQEAHAFRKAMEDSLLVGMRARDLEGRIIYVNPALCEMCGYTAEELMGRKPPYPYWHPDDMEQHWLDNEATLSGRAAHTGFESRMRHRDGHDVHTLLYTAPLIDGAGRHSGWMISVVDMSTQKRAEEQRRLHEEQLRHAARLASLGEMASTLAHELNQPLMALSSFASAAQAFARQGNHGLLVSSLDDIAAQAQRAAEIVRRVRGFVRQHTQGVEPVALNECVSSVLALLRPEIRQRKARVVTRLQADLPAVHGDRVLLEQVLLNLVLNGLQAMQDMPAHRRIVEIDTVAAEGRVTLSVADHGPGIDPKAAAQLFTSFFTTKQDGLGLGLNICRTIIESHRGRLSFDSRSGGGAVFTVQLNAAP
jgi:two-component system, LuxR family, sensor histidine kinase DctS